MPQSIDATTLKSWIDTHQVILIDVREPDEFRAEHIPAALSLPLSSLPDNMAKLTMPSGARVVFQCLSGKRGGNACLLAEQGLCEDRDIYNLEGGISAWKDAGLPTIGMGNTPKISIFRQVQMIVGTLIFFCIGLGFLMTSTFFILAGIFGGMLAFAGYTGWCGLALLLQRAPWNK